MSSLFFWFVYFTLDAVYKVEAVFMVLDRTGQPAFTSSHLTTNQHIHKLLNYDTLEGSQ